MLAGVINIEVYTEVVSVVTLSCTSGWAFYNDIPNFVELSNDFLF